MLAATRPHIECYRAALEERGLAASTIDRRLSTVCGFYRYAHIDGRVTSNPAQDVRRPKVPPSVGAGMDRTELGTFLFTAERFDRDHAALAVLLGLNGLRVSEACATNVEDLGVERGHRTLRIMGKGQEPAVVPLVPRTARTIDLALGERYEGPILLVARRCPSRPRTGTSRRHGPRSRGAQTKMMHVEVAVDDLEAAVELVVRAGGRVAPTQPADRHPGELRVMLDPAGHPFCLCRWQLPQTAGSAGTLRLGRLGWLASAE